MTEVTITEISTDDITTELLNGTARTRLTILVRCTSAGTGDTLDLASYVPNLTGIETIHEELDGAANAGSDNTWSTTTITYAGHAGSGVWVQKIIGYF